MCPDVNNSQIQLAMMASSGNPDEAAQRLLGDLVSILLIELLIIYETT